MKRITVLMYVLLAVSVLFSVSSISLLPGIEMMAFPLVLLFTVVIAYLIYICLLKQNDTLKLPLIRKLLEYLPFVQLIAFILRRAGGSEIPFFIDCAGVFLWVVSFVLSLMILRLLKNKNSPFAGVVAKKLTGMKRVVLEFFEWIDAFVQAAFMVALINIFIFQLYEIPSESMVPQFFIKDRVMVFKTNAGPSFPLTDISIPRLRSYDRGDIAVFRNPHYAYSRKNEVKTFINQLVYMVTFTTVKLNVDASGMMIADPLVKRVTGVPGEQLVMVDGVLYARTADSLDFAPVEADATWAEWNLNDVSSDQKKNIHDFPVSPENFSVLESIEAQRRNIDFAAVAKEAAGIANRFDRLYTSLTGKNAEASGSIPDLYNENEMSVQQLFSNNENITRKLLTVNGGCAWFRAFMTDWISAVPQEAYKGGSTAGDDLYQDSMFRLNTLLKMTFGRLVLRNLEIISDGFLSSSADSLRIQYMTEAQKLYYYTMLNDSRNMPVFPANVNGKPSYIADNNFFMMGDNRFNSLDMRHSYDKKQMAISNADAYSMTYYSRLAPQTVSIRRILGSTCLRFWPLSRFGLTKTK